MTATAKILPTEVQGVFKHRPGSARGFFDGRVEGVVRIKHGRSIKPVEQDAVPIRVNFSSTARGLLLPNEVTGVVRPFTVHGPQGPEGPQGPPGAGAASQFPAAGVVGALRLVINGGNGVEHADFTNPEHGLQILGVSLQSAINQGDLITVQQSGSLSDPSFAFTPGLPVYANAMGVLTQTIPSDPNRAWQTIVGHATDENTLFINTRDTVFLC